MSLLSLATGKPAILSGLLTDHTCVGGDSLTFVALVHRACIFLVFLGPVSDLLLERIAKDWSSSSTRAALMFSWVVFVARNSHCHKGCKQACMVSQSFVNLCDPYFQAQRNGHLFHARRTIFHHIF